MIDTLVGRFDELSAALHRSHSAEGAWNDIPNYDTRCLSAAVDELLVALHFFDIQDVRLGMGIGTATSSKAKRPNAYTSRLVAAFKRLYSLVVTTMTLVVQKTAESSPNAILTNYNSASVTSVFRLSSVLFDAFLTCKKVVRMKDLLEPGAEVTLLMDYCEELNKLVRRLLDIEMEEGSEEAEQTEQQAANGNGSDVIVDETLHHIDGFDDDVIMDADEDDEDASNGENVANSNGDELGAELDPDVGVPQGRIISILSVEARVLSMIRACNAKDDQLNVRIHVKKALFQKDLITFSLGFFFLAPQ